MNIFKTSCTKLLSGIPPNFTGMIIGSLRSCSVIPILAEFCLPWQQKGTTFKIFMSILFPHLKESISRFDPVAVDKLFEDIHRRMRDIRAFGKQLNLCKTVTLKYQKQNGFQDRLSLNAGQTYCRMPQREHSAILSTFIKLPVVIVEVILSIFEWPFYTDFTVLRLKSDQVT